MRSVASLDTTTSSNTSEIHIAPARPSKDALKDALNKLMLLFVLNVVDLAVVAFFCCYDVLVLPEPMLVSADVFYVLSLLMLLFAIKFKHALCLGMAAVCQVAAFGLKVAGYVYAEDEGVRLVTLAMALVMAAFTLVPLGVARLWRKVDEDSWVEKFDKELKMRSYKSPHAHFEHE